MKTTDPTKVSSAMQNEINELRSALEISHSECLEQARLLGMGGEREATLLSQVEQLTREANAKVQGSLMDRCVALSDQLFELGCDFKGGHASQIFSMSSHLKIYSHQLEAGAKLAAERTDKCASTSAHQDKNVFYELPEPVHHIMVDGKCIGYFSAEQMLRLRVDSVEQCAKVMESPNNNYAQVIRKRMGL